MNPLFQNSITEPLVLASRSPRRKELLESLGLSFQVIPGDIDEEGVQAKPYELVRLLAEMKSSVIAVAHPDSWVLGADTIVVVGEEILGKPTDRADALRMIRLLSGRTHLVLGGVSLQRHDLGFAESFVIETTVEFAVLSEECIAHYVGSGESLDKAGGYAIQGAGQVLVKSIHGSYTNVIGLDLPSISRLLLEVGVSEWR